MQRKLETERDGGPGGRQHHLMDTRGGRLLSFCLRGVDVHVHVDARWGWVVGGWMDVQPGRVGWENGTQCVGEKRKLGWMNRKGAVALSVGIRDGGDDGDDGGPGSQNGEAAEADG